RRGDAANAMRIAETEIGGDAQPGFVTASRALADPALWAQAKAEFDRVGHERTSWRFIRVLVPETEHDTATMLGDLDEMRQRGESSWHLLQWSPELAWLRRDPAFQGRLRDTGIL